MEKFRDAPALIPQYYHNTDGIVLVFDLSEKDSFDGLGNWISEMKRHSTRRSRTDKINMILVGNKLDLKQERVVCAQGICNDWGSCYGDIEFPCKKSALKVISTVRMTLIDGCGCMAMVISVGFCHLYIIVN